MKADLALAQRYVEACPELADGVPVYIRTRLNTDLLKAPRFVQIVLTPQVMANLERNRQLCAQHDLTAVQELCDPAAVDDSSDVAWVGLWYLTTDGMGFWLRGDADSAGAVVSDTVEFISLTQALRARPAGAGAARLHGNLTWFGGALLCDGNDVDAMRTVIGARFPAIAARQTALDMATAIQSVTDAAAPPPDGASARRRPSL